MIVGATTPVTCSWLHRTPASPYHDASRSLRVSGFLLAPGVALSRSRVVVEGGCKMTRHEHRVEVERRPQSAGRLVLDRSGLAAWMLAGAAYVVLGAGGAFAEDEVEAEDEDATGAVLKSECGRECMPKCFTSFGAALVPDNRADVEVYCKSKCVVTCDKEAGGSVKSGGAYCKEGKQATSVEKGVYTTGLEFYGCK